MRFSLLAIALFCFFHNSFAQIARKMPAHNISKEDIRSIMKANRENRPFSVQWLKNIQQKKNMLSVSVLKNPAALSLFINSRSAASNKTTSGALPVARKNTKTLSGGGCVDSSFYKLLSIDYNVIYVTSITHTRDDGVLLIGQNFINTPANTYPIGQWQTKGMLIKVDTKGNVLWIKQFADANNDKYYATVLCNVAELQNGDLLLTGDNSQIDTVTTASSYNTPIYRLTSQGNLIWYKDFNTSLVYYKDVSPMEFRGITEGPDGAIVLSGNTFDTESDSLFETYIKLGSDGTKLWDAHFGNTTGYHFSAEGVNAFIENNTVVAVGISHGDDNPGTPPAINFLTLDYATGKTLNRRFFVPPGSYFNSFPDQFTYYYNNCVRLANGHYIFYGTLFSDVLQSTDTVLHYGIVEFDAAQNYTGNAYAIASLASSSYSADMMHFEPDGSCIFDLYTLTSASNEIERLLISTMRNGQFAKQRVIDYNNVSIGTSNGYANGLFCFMNDGGYMFANTDFFNLAFDSNYFELRKMHDSDTSSACLGRDSVIAMKTPFAVVEDPGYYDLDSPLYNYVTDTTYPITISDTLVSAVTNPCAQQSNCDTVKIHGNNILCGSQQQVVFTAYKNTLCGSNVLWNIDSTAVDSINYINDTSVAITFKNLNWQGYLRASLSTGTCTLPVNDSLLLHVTGANDSIMLGNDTILCSKTSLILHAGNQFASYQWQDGSIDSNYTVTQPGKYYVTAIDYCLNKYSDTINVNFANNYFSLGNDTSICLGDTILLKATGGFSNYQWKPAYNINIVGSDSIAQVFPLTDTSYMVSAQKFAGCIFNDTIHISIIYPVPINLGNDTSFCSGDSIVLDAGNGFTNYLWSNGSTSFTIIVKSAGSYFVVATNSNGCKSKDTLQVLKLFALPVPDLSKDSLLCAGDTKILDAGVGYISYLWQDGSMNETFSVSSIGVYSVQVTDKNGCKGSDSTSIVGILPLPANFLPADTSICNYASLLVQPLQSFSFYDWSDGSNTASITVKTAGIYALTVTDENGCKGTDSIQVGINDCLGGAYFANAFTPNGDGHNDVYRPIMLGVVLKYHFLIYNRYGQLMYESTTPGAGWDGVFNGKKQDAGTYAWSCIYQFAGDKERTAKGSVVLIR